MPVNVVGGDGALNFTTNIDLGNADSQLDTLQNKLVNTFQAGATANKSFNDSVMSTLKGAGASFDPKPVQDWSNAIQKATAQLQEIIAKGKSGLNPDQLKELGLEVGNTQTSFKQLSETIDFIKQNIGSLNLNPEDLQTLTTSIQTIESSFDGFQDKTVKVTTQIRALKNEMSSISDKGSPEFIALANEAGKLQREVDESNKSVQLLASTTGGLQAGVGVLRGVVGGFEAVAGAVGLASGKSEEMQGVISSIIASMGVLNGIQEVADVVNKRSALNQYLLLQYRRLTAGATTEAAVATEGLAAATEVETIATEEATVAQVELNAAMGLNPALAVVAGIAALAAAVYFLTQKSHDADEASTRLNKTLLDQYNVSNQIFQLSKFAANNTIAAQEANIESARAANDSQKEILARQIELDKLKQDQAQKDVQKAKDDLTGANSLAKTITDSFNAFAKLQGIKVKPIDLGFENTTNVDELIKKLGLLETKLVNLKNSTKANKDKSEVEKLQSNVDELKPKITAYIDSLKNLSTATTKTAVDATSDATKRYQDDQKSFVAAQDAKTLALGKSSADQLEITLNAIKAQAAAQLNPKLNPDLTNGEKEKIQADSLKKQAEAVFQFNQKQFTDQVKLLNSEAQLYKEGTKQRLDLELQAIALSTKAQLQQQIQLNGQTIQFRQLSAEQIAAVNNDANKQVADKNKAFNKQVADDALETQIALDNAKLASIRSGSEQELILKKKLVDDQETLDTTNAQFTINNEELLAARLKEIHAKSVEEKMKLDDDYLNHYLDNQFKIIDQGAEASKSQNNSILNDTTAGAQDRFKAQISNLDIDANAINDKINDINLAIYGELTTGNTNIDALLTKRLELFKKLDKVDQTKTTTTIKDNDDQLQREERLLDGVGNSIGKLGSNLKQYDSTLGDVLTALGNIAHNAATIESLLKSTASDTDKEIAALEAVVQLISLVISAAAQRAQAEAQQNAELLQQQQDYNLALNENILLNSKLKENVFGQDFQGELKDSIAALTDAQQNYQKSLAALVNGQAKAGIKNVASGSAILSGLGSGAVAGAEIGSFLGPEGTIIGGAIGAVVGGIVGFFGGKKPADKYVALLTAYPNLLEKGANGADQINVALAKSLITNNQLDASTKVLVQDTLDWQTAIDQANQQLKDVIGNLAGSLGSDLADSLVQAFEQGTDAGKAFAGSVQKTLENVLKNMLFNNVFGAAFTDLQNKLQASFQTGGDFNWQDDLESFFQQYSGLSQTFDDALKAAQTEAKAAGLDIFQSTAAANSSGNTLSGAIKGITEQQADLLAGQFGGLRLTAIDQLKVSQTSLTALNDIVFNTSMLLDIKATLNYFKINGMKAI